jgi:transcriptional regulator with XRE-family HTH domain
LIDGIPAHATQAEEKATMEDAVFGKSPDGSPSTPDSTPSTVPPPQGTLAQRLLTLLDWYQENYGIRPSANDIARAINAAGGKISHTTVSALLSGSNDNPVLRTIVDLADFFDVDPSYFVVRNGTATTDTEGSTEERLRRLARANPQTAEQVELLFAMKQAGVTRVGARGFAPTGAGREAMLRILRGVGRLSEDGQTAVAGVIEAMEQMSPTDRDHQRP